MANYRSIISGYRFVRIIVAGVSQYQMFFKVIQNKELGEVRWVWWHQDIPGRAQTVIDLGVVGDKGYKLKSEIIGYNGSLYGALKSSKPQIYVVDEWLTPKSFLVQDGVATKLHLAQMKGPLKEFKAIFIPAKGNYVVGIRFHGELPDDLRDKSLIGRANYISAGAAAAMA